MNISLIEILIVYYRSSLQNVTEQREFFVFFIISDGKELSLFISEHCFAKKELKISAFSLKSVTSLFS